MRETFNQSFLEKQVHKFADEQRWDDVLDVLKDLDNPNVMIGGMGLAHKAAKFADVSVFLDICALDCDFTLKDDDQNIPLHYLAERGIVCRMGRQYYEIKNGAGETVSHIYARNGFAEAYATYVKDGANQHARDDKGNTPVHNCAKAGFLKINGDTRLQVLNNDQQTIGHMAAIGGNLNCLLKYLDKGGSLYDKDFRGRLVIEDVVFNKSISQDEIDSIPDLSTRKYFAKAIGSVFGQRLQERDLVAISKLVSEYRFSQKQMINIYNTAIENNEGILAAVLKQGIDFGASKQSSSEPAPQAKKKHNSSTAQQVKKDTVDWHSTNQHNQNRAHIAALNEDWKLFDELKVKGVNCCAKDEFGNTPDHYAARKGYACYVEGNTDYSIQDAEKRTVAHILAYDKEWDVLEFTLKYGAPYSGIDSRGLTPLHIALDGRYVVKSIAYDPTAVFDEGGDCLFGDALGGSVSHAVEFYVRKLNANPNVDLGDGLTPLIAAIALQDSRMQSTLIGLGADPHFNPKTDLVNTSPFILNLVLGRDEDAKILDRRAYDKLIRRCEELIAEKRNAQQAREEQREFEQMLARIKKAFEPTKVNPEQKKQQQAQQQAQNDNYRSTHGPKKSASKPFQSSSSSYVHKSYEPSEYEKSQERVFWGMGNGHDEARTNSKPGSGSKGPY